MQSFFRGQCVSFPSTDSATLSIGCRLMNSHQICFVSAQANCATDYLAVGIDASWLLINGLDAGCMWRFRDYISLSDWVTKLGLEQSIARKIGLSGKDFIALGWDYQSLVRVRAAMISQLPGRTHSLVAVACCLFRFVCCIHQSLDYTARQLEALGVDESSVNTGFAGKSGRSTHMARKKLDQAERTRDALLSESLPTRSTLPSAKDVSRG